MSSENAPEKAAAEEQAPAQSSGISQRIQWAVEGAQGAWQRLRIRFGAPAPEGEPEGEVAVDAVPVGKRPITALRIVFFAGGTALIGIFAGMWMAYGLFAKKIDSQEAEITAQRQTLIRLEKENRRAQLVETEYRDSLVEAQRALADTQRRLAQATAARNKGDVLPGAKASLPALSFGRSRSMKTIQPPAPPPLSGTCDINSSNAAEGLARCINELNR